MLFVEATASPAKVQGKDTGWEHCKVFVVISQNYHEYKFSMQGSRNLQVTVKFIKYIQHNKTVKNSEFRFFHGLKFLISIEI